MVRNYNLSKRLLAYLLVLSLFLQSCGNVPNQIKPIKHQAESGRPGSSKQDDIHQLLEQDFTAEKGYIVTFYEVNGDLKANVKVDTFQPPIYKGLPVTIEKGTKIAELRHLDPPTQQQRIQLHQPQNRQPGRVIILKGGLLGGMLEGDDYQEKEKEAESGKLNNWEIEELLAYAQSGNREAQFKLGERSYKAWQQYYQEKDLQEAKKWLEKAAAQRHEVAIDLLKATNIYNPYIDPLRLISKNNGIEIKDLSTQREKEEIANYSKTPQLSGWQTFRNRPTGNQSIEKSKPSLILSSWRTVRIKSKKESLPGYQENSQKQLKKRIIAQLAQPAYYQRIKLELHKRLLSPSLSQEQQASLSALIKLITAPEKKLRLGGSYEIREDFRANPTQEHNLFEPLRVHLEKLTDYKQKFLCTPIELLLEELIKKHQAFTNNLIEQVKKLGPTAPLKLFEAKPVLQGEGFNCYEVEANKAYQLACYNLHEYEYVRSNPSGLSIGSMHGDVYFKVDNGTGLLRPAKEHAVYSLYQALGLVDLLSPTHLVTINGLSILPPDIGESPERRELSQKKQELQTPSTQEVFNHYPELEQKLKFAQKERSLFIQGSLVIPGKTLEKFLEEAEKSPNPDSIIQQLEPASFSGHVLASLLLLPTDYKADNLMVDEQNRIIGIDNDAALEAAELRRLNSFNKHAISIKNILYLLPLMQSGITATIQRQFIEVHPALFLLNWLIGLQNKQLYYDYLLDASLVDYENTIQIKKHAEYSLGLPLQFVPGWIASMHERFTKVQTTLKGNSSITHQELFEQIHPFASRYYNAVKKLFSHPLDQIAFIYEKTPKDFEIAISNTFEDLVAQYPEAEDERLLNNLAQSCFIKQDPSLSITQAIQELIATIDLKKYDASEQLSYVERVAEVGIWPDRLHDSWYDPLLLIHMIAEGASNKAIKAIIDKGNADIHAHDANGEAVLHAAVRRGGQDALRQIPTLIKIGADKEAQDQYGISPLDLAAEKANLDIFKLLIDLGGGEKAIHNKINDFYKKLSDREKKELVPHITKLTQVHPKAGWKISLDEIFPIQGEAKGILRTVTEGDRVISEEAWDKLFEKDGKPKKANAYGVRSVPFVEKNGQRIYVKFLPQLPGTELAVIRLAENLLGYCAPYCELASINGIPVLLTQGIPGETLYEALKNHPEKLNQIDPESLSKALILAILINPGDGNLGNYILSPFTNAEGEECYRLISIDNDQAFMPAVAKTIKTGLWGSPLSLQVKTILYCLEAVKQPVNQKIIDKIKNADLLKILENWLSSLKIHHEAAKNHFDSTLLRKHQQDKTTVIGVAFAPGMIKQLFTKLMRLQTVLNTKKAPMHFELLETLEPFVAHRYRTVIMDTRLNSIEKFQRAENITEEQALTSSSNALTQLLISRDVPEAGKLQAALWSGKYGPDQALQELEEVEKEHTKLSQILKDLGQLNISTLRRSTTGITEKLLQEADLTRLSLTQQKALLDAIKAQELRYVQLRNCNALKGALLTSFNLEHIKKIDLSGCSNLKAIPSGLFKGSPLIMPILTHFRLDKSGVTVIRLQAEQLRKLTLRKCRKLKDIELIASKLHRLDLRGATGLTQKAIRSLFEQFPNAFIYLTPTPAFTQQVCANYLNEQGLTHLASNEDELAAHYLKQSAEQGNTTVRSPLIKLALQGNSIAQSWIIEQAEEGNETTRSTLDLSENKISLREIINLIKILPNMRIHTLNLEENQIGVSEASKLAEVLPDTLIHTLNLGHNQIGDEGVIKLAEALPNSQINTLDLNSNNIGDPGAIKLVEVLPSSKIHTLNLQFNKIGDSGITKLADTLSNTKIHKLDLWSNQIGDEGVIKLAEALPHTQIHTLNLNSNKIGDSGMTKLVKNLFNTHIHTLNLADNQIGDSGMIKLAEELSNTRIHTLDLRYNQIGDSGMIKLAEGLSNTRIHTLYLGENQIGNSASKLAEALPNSQIHTLDLSRNEIGDSGASKLAEALPNTLIHTLDLSSNQIGDSGASKLAEALPNSQINILDLSSNQIEYLGASKLAEALPNTLIHTLDLQHNKIKSSGASKLAEALPNTQIHTLNLAANQIGDSGAGKLAEALPNTLIHTLDLKINYISRFGVSKLAKALPNTDINKLDLSCNKIDYLGAWELAISLPTTRIHTLNLKETQISNEGASKLVEALPHTQIHTLNLECNHIWGGMQDLSRYKSNPNIKL